MYHKLLYYFISFFNGSVLWVLSYTTSWIHSQPASTLRFMSIMWGCFPVLWPHSVVLCFLHGVYWNCPVIYTGKGNHRFLTPVLLNDKLRSRSAIREVNEFLISLAEVWWDGSDIKCHFLTCIVFSMPGFPLLICQMKKQFPRTSGCFWVSLWHNYGVSQWERDFL